MTIRSHRLFLIAWVIWGSSLAGLIAMLLIAQFLRTGPDPNITTDNSILWMRTSAYAIAIILFPLIRILRHSLTPNSLQASPTPQHLPANHKPESRALIGMLLAFALAETIGALGLGLLIIGDTLQTLYLFIGIAALALLLNRPQAQEFNQE